MPRPRKPDVDWAAAEEKLFDEASTRIREIAVEFPKEQFYGICFECDLVYTAVQAHMNTDVLLRESAIEYKKPQPPFSTLLAQDKTIEQVMDLLRWETGGWGHFVIFGTPDFSDIAAAMETLCEKLDGDAAEMFLKDDLMTMACRAVVRLEHSGVFELLNKTDDFRVLCEYRELAIETQAASARRLNRIRRSLTTN